MKACMLVLASLLFLSAVQCHTASEWKSNRVIYQVLVDRFYSESSTSCSNLTDYCGGTWKGISLKLDYIQKLGFNAIWISPIVENTENGYHGYWAKNFSELNSHFGTKDDLLELVQMAHARNIWVMVDLVFNHVGPAATGYTGFFPFDKVDYYHPQCTIGPHVDWNSQESIEICWLAGNLPDLNQSVPFVESELISWAENVMSEYHFDGIRIDTVRHVNKEFWGALRTHISGYYQLGEVFSSDIPYVADYQNYLDGLLGYPLYESSLEAFSTNASLDLVATAIENCKSSFDDYSVLGNFVDNHDNPRFLSKNPDVKLFENYATSLFFLPGIPIVYYGSEQGFNGAADPQNREIMFDHFQETGELYTFFMMLNTIYADLSESDISDRFNISVVASQYLAFIRGDFLVVVTKAGDGSSMTVSVDNHPFLVGEILCDYFRPQYCLEVGPNTTLEISVTNGEPVILHYEGNAPDQPNELIQWILSTGIYWFVSIVVIVVFLAILTIVCVVFYILFFHSWAKAKIQQARHEGINAVISDISKDFGVSYLIMLIKGRSLLKYARFRGGDTDENHMS